MKRIFTFVAALMAVVAINATQVVLNPADMPQMTTAGAYNQTFEGVQVQISNGIVNESQIRIYKNQTISFTCANPISAIEFTCTASGTSKYGPGCFTAQDGYSYESNKGVWDGSATSVTFTASSDQVRASKIVVYLDGEKPSTEEVPVDTIGVSEAIARIKANNKGPCYVKGVVAGDPFLLGAYGPAFYMVDIANPMDSLEGFKIDKDNETAFTDVADMASVLGAGDTIMIYAGGLDKFNSIYETTFGYFVEMLGKSASIELDWANGSAYREEGTWELEIEKVAGDAANVMHLIFNSDKEDAIGGFHNLDTESNIIVDGVNVPIASGSVQLTFKEVSTNGYNVYTVKVTAIAGEQLYRLNKEIEFYASKDGDEIDLAGDRPFIPNEGDTITCAQAREYVLSLPSGGKGMTVTVRGFVTKIINTDKVYNTFWMDDEQGTKETFEVAFYKEISPLGVQLKVGDEVIATGATENYNGKTPEIANGSVTVVGAEVNIDRVSVAEALNIAQALDTNTVTTELYEVEAFIASVAYEYSAKYGNISLWLTDNADDHSETFQAYRAKCDSAIVDQLVAGAKIYVIGNLKHHYSAEKLDSTGAVLPERHSYEVVNGTISLHATAVENVVVTKEEVVKFFKNGQIYIRRNDGLYNIQGIKVD